MNRQTRVHNEPVSLYILFSSIISRQGSFLRAAAMMAALLALSGLRERSPRHLTGAIQMPIPLKGILPLKR